MAGSVPFIIMGSSSSSDDEGVIPPRSILRMKNDPFSLPSVMFKQRFRITKNMFSDLLNELELRPASRRGAITPTLKLAVTLELLSGGNYQTITGNDFTINMNQTTVSKVFSEMLDVMEQKLCAKYIKFQASEHSKTFFFDKYKIPSVVGCVDGTLISILRPKEDEHTCYSRKGRHAINGMIICDHQYKIMAINAIYGGASHDSFVWQHSEERKMLVNQYAPTKNCWLLGDSGYPLEPWLMTPYSAPLAGTAESAFNAAHSSARSVVERCIGVLKTRWRILLDERKMRYSRKKMIQVINVCCALHNICIENNLVLDENIDIPSEENDPLTQAENNNRTIAEQLRNQIKQLFI